MIEVSYFIDNLRDFSKVNYFSIILGDLNLLIDNFLSISFTYVTNFDYLKEVIERFEKLRTDYHYKLKGNSKSQALSKESIEFLNIIFTYIRFILTKFGRIISCFVWLEQLYNRRLLSRHLTSSNKPPTNMSLTISESGFPG